MKRWRLQAVIVHLLDAIYHIAIWLQLFIPGTAETVLARLGQKSQLHWVEEGDIRG